MGPLERTLASVSRNELRKGRHKRGSYDKHMQDNTNIKCCRENIACSYPLYGLAELCLVQKKYEQSELLYRQTLSICQQCLGEKHLGTAEALQGLADLYREWARYEEAAPLYVQAMAIREKILGWESLSILQARQTYAAMLQRMERDTEAK